MQATSLTPLDALRLSYAEAQLELNKDEWAAAQPGRRLTQFLTSSSQSQQELTVSQAQHNYCGKGPPPERLIIGRLKSQSLRCSRFQMQSVTRLTAADCAVAAAHYNLDFLDRLGLQYVAYQHLDPEEPFYYNNAGGCSVS